MKYSHTRAAKINTLFNAAMCFEFYSTEKRMLRLYTDVILHLKKQSMSEIDPPNAGVNASEIRDLQDMVNCD